MTIRNTREAWLCKASHLIVRSLIKPAFEATPAWTDANYLDVPEERLPHVSVGFPKTRGRGADAIGQAWPEARSGDERGHIFISPNVTDPVHALEVLLHELIHLVVGIKHGHKGQFKVAALACGLQGRMTATTGSPELVVKLKRMVQMLERLVGPWSNVGLNAASIGAATRPGSPLLKIECMTCGCLLRMTLKWIDKVGLPTCGCGGEMVLRHNGSSRKAN